MNALLSICKDKKAFYWLVHDRHFIDSCCDHVMAINPTTIDIVNGNFSSWYNDKTKKDEREMMLNKKLKKDIVKMEKSKTTKRKLGASD